MSTPPSIGASEASAKFAAGGLVWRRNGIGEFIAVVHRTQHNDWVLPKGKPVTNETLEATALREAQEETGKVVSLGPFAGTYSYLVDGKPKVVFLWHMLVAPGEFSPAADSAEIDERAWLSPEQAQQRLTYPAEREFVARHACGTTLVQAVRASVSSPERTKLERLAAALQTVRERFSAVTGRTPAAADAWWAATVRSSIAAAEAALIAGQLDTGWGALHDAERRLICGFADPELITRAINLRSETEAKLKGWRGNAAAGLLAAMPLADWLKEGKIPDGKRPALENAVVEALTVLHDGSNNVYHRLQLVGHQLRIMVSLCFALVLLVLLASLFADCCSMFTFDQLFPVLLAGAFGGVVSTMFQLSRVGEAKIPEALMHGIITSGRPLIGAVSALFIYVLLKSGFIKLPEDSKMAEPLILGFTFVAGFTDRLVLSSVAKLAGNDKTADPTNRPLS